MSWFGNQRQDRELLRLVLDMAGNPDVPVITEEWTYVHRLSGSANRYPQLIHRFGEGVEVRRPAPCVVTMGDHLVVVDGHGIVPNRIWRSRFASTMTQRARLFAARSLAASIASMTPPRRRAMTTTIARKECRDRC